MSYNYIAMDDDGTTSFAGGSWQQNGVGGNIDIEEQRTTALIGGVSIIDPTMSSEEFIRRCKQQYYFEFSWQVPFPQLTAAPLLYIPETLRELLHDSKPLGVMQAELDAMSDTVLERIPLAYYLLSPRVVDETRRIAIECEQRMEEMQRLAAAAGLPELLTWKPEDVNKYLDKADAKLLDTYIDFNLIFERDKPSLTLLQRPLYTDMGMVPQEQRHLDRLGRIFPEALRNQGILSLFQSSESKGETPDASGRLETNFSNSIGDLTRASLNKGQLGVEDPQKWLDGVKRSFRCARTIDKHYEELLEAVARTKLGLDSSCSAVVRFTRKFWCLLFEGTHKSQQRDIWCHLCRFSYNYNGSRETVAELRTALTSLQLPQLHLWHALLEEYMDLLERDASTQSVGGLLRRKEQLQISGNELDFFQQGAFELDLQLGPSLRRAGKGSGGGHQLPPIYPVEVIPLYPAGFDEMVGEDMVAGGGEERRERLGEQAKGLHHILLPAAVVGDDSWTDGPHVLVNNMELLVAEDKGTTRLGDGPTVSYRASRENTFERLVEDEKNTSSYLLRLCEVQADETPAGLANANGRYIVYNRLDIRDLFVKAPNAETPPYEHYVVMFDVEEGLKRPRDVYNNAEERRVSMQRVE